MKQELESAMTNVARATGRLATMLTRCKARPTELIEIADLLDLASERLRKAAEKSGRR